MGSDEVRVCTPQLQAVISLGCFRGVHPLLCKHTHTPNSVSEAAAPPIRMMACKANLYSIVITKQLYTCKYTATDCAIVTLAEDRDWIRV